MLTPRELTFLLSLLDRCPRTIGEDIALEGILATLGYSPSPEQDVEAQGIVAQRPVSQDAEERGSE